jgi:hypothetical protein
MFLLLRIIFSIVIVIIINIIIIIIIIIIIVIIITIIIIIIIIFIIIVINIITPLHLLLTWLVPGMKLKTSDYWAPVAERWLKTIDPEVVAKVDQGIVSAAEARTRVATNTVATNTIATNTVATNAVATNAVVMQECLHWKEEKRL